MQGVSNLFEVDTVHNILNNVEKITGKKYGENEAQDISIRIITDHIRSTVFMVSDGILPSNEAVSYTHLDVYKRQVWWKTPWRAACRANTHERKRPAENATKGAI